MASDELLLMGLESDANDYERLDHIADQIAKWTETPVDRLDVEKIRAAQADAINSGYVEAYKLNSTPPHAIKVSTMSASLAKLWFLITEQGKARCLRPHIADCRWNPGADRRARPVKG
jgi:hypothetical protein